MKNIYDKSCKTCGRSFSGGPRASYCPDCGNERAKQQNKAQKRNGAIRPLGSIDKCTVCGKDYTVCAGRQKYCKNCAVPAVKEIDRRQGLEYYKKTKVEINPKRNEKRRIERKCVVCDKPFEAKTRQLTCSAECKRIYINKKWLDRYHKRPADS